MPFTPPKESFSGKICEMGIGREGVAVSLGGQAVMPFHTFEEGPGAAPGKPAIAFEVQDVAPEDWPETVRGVFKDVSGDPVAWAAYCQDSLGADAIALRLVGTHPDRGDIKAEQAAETVSRVLGAIRVPLIVLGSNHAEKDTSVLVRVAEVLKGTNSVFGKAQEANYKTIAAAAMANDLKLIAMSELDINLSKQLNILITQMGFNRERLITDPMSSALSYGLEYTYSVMERIRLAALAQNDPILQTPMLADVGMYVWKVKETLALESDVPEWGELAKRGVAWEAVTASAFLISGADLLIMRHPDAAGAVKKFIAEMEVR